MGHSTNKQTSTVYGKLTESYKVKLTVLNRNLELQEINRYDLKLIYCILFSLLVALNEVINNLGHTLLI